MNPSDYDLDHREAPLDMDAATFAEVGHQLVDDIAGLLASTRERPLSQGRSTQDVRQALNAARPLPAAGQDAATTLREATDLLLENSIFNGHPRFFGYITGSPAPIGMLGDLLAAAINPNMGAWALSPMASEMEAQAVRWIAELTGYPEGAGGLLVSGGNVANMVAFWAARAAKAGPDMREAGVARDASGQGGQMRLYAGTGTHTWIQKATDLSGLGTDAVRWIDVDDQGRLDLVQLRERIEEDRTSGDRPFMVVGTGGSVSTGVVDPLSELRVICDDYDLWFHVDGAYGAFGAAAPNAPDELQHLGLADSVALDPHKWLYTPLEAGCALVRDPNALLGAFSYRPEYYNFGEEVTNYFEHGIQNSRGFRALKVWLQLRHVGRDAYARMIAEDIELARRFFGIADAHDQLEAFTHGLSITTYRFVPMDLQARVHEDIVDRYLSDLNRSIQATMEGEGRAFVSNAMFGDRYTLRMCITNFRTGQADIEELADITVELGERLDTSMRPEEIGRIPLSGVAPG